jgi:hypothetical protein
MRQTTRRAKSSNLPIFQSSNLPAGSLSHDAKSSGCILAGEDAAGAFSFLQ